MNFDAESAQPFNPQQAAPAGPAPAALAAAPAPAAPAQPPSGASLVDEAGSMLWTALHSAYDAGTFGLTDKASAGLASLISPLTGKPMSYDEAYAKIQANNAANASRNPISAVAGDIAGTLVGAGKLAKVARAIPGVSGVMDALAPQAGAPVTNVLKSALTGGVTSGAYTAADDLVRNGDVNPDNIITNAAVGAVVGPAASKIGTMMVKGVQSASTKAMMLLADKLGESPGVLQRAYDNFQAATGRLPTMAEIVGMKSQGELEKLASTNPIVRQGLNEAADTASEQRPRSLAQTIEDNSGGPTQDINQLTQARKERMDAAMKPIKTRKVLVTDQDTDLLTDPRVSAAVRATKIPELRTKLDDAVQEAEENGHSSLLTVDDMDSIRKAVRQQQTNMLNPASTAHNAQGARSMGNLADNLTGIVTRGDSTHPYAQALSQFEQDSNYIKGFKHGVSGKSINEAGTPDLIDALNEAEGRAGHQAGIASRTAAQAAASEGGAVRTADQLAQGTGDSAVLAQAVGPKNFANIQVAAAAESKGAQALKNVTGKIPTDEPALNPYHVGQTVAAAASHSPVGLLSHVARAIPSFAKQSPAVQKQIIRYLADPSMTQQGINLLRKAGAKEQEIRNLAVAISASAGANTANTMGQ